MYLSFASLRVMGGKDAKIMLRLIDGFGSLAEISILSADGRALYSRRKM
jgi:hypothetical protein